MLQAPASIQKLLFATDFSAATAAAFSHAISIANRYQSKLYVAHVISLDSVELLDDEPARVLIENTRKEAVRRISDLSSIANRYQSKLYVAHVISLDSVELLDDEPARVLIENTRKEAVRRISDL